jgi:hypothetical protein
VAKEVSIDVSGIPEKLYSRQAAVPQTQATIVRRISHDVFPMSLLYHEQLVAVLTLCKNSYCKIKTLTSPPPSCLPGPRLKPVFVRKRDRVTLQERDKNEEKEKELEEEKKKLAEIRRKETLKVAAMIRQTLNG